MNNRLVVILCLVYITVFIVLRIYHKPNFKFFYSFQDRNSNNSDSCNTINSIEGFEDNVPSAELKAEIEKAIEESQLKFHEHKKVQIKQDELIDELKNFVNQARDELIIHRKRENKDSNIYSNVSQGDSLTQVMSGSSSIINSLGKFGDAGSKAGNGKDYNLNFNLDDE